MRGEVRQEQWAMWDFGLGIADWGLRIGEFWDFRFPILDFGFLNGEFGMQSAEG